MAVGSDIPLLWRRLDFNARGDIADVLPKFREMVREAGRDLASIEVTLFGLGEDLDRVSAWLRWGHPRGPDVPAGEGGYGAELCDRDGSLIPFARTRIRLHWSYLASREWFKLPLPPRHSLHPTV